MTHTPGPWHRGSDFNDNRFVIFSETGRMRLEPGQGTVLYSIAQVFNAFSENEDDANARLIAAAPDMLEAIKNALRHIRSIQAYDDSVAVPKAFAISALHEGLKSAGIENLASI